MYKIKPYAEMFLATVVLFLFQTSTQHSYVDAETWIFTALLFIWMKTMK